MKEDIEFSDEYRDFDAELEAMITFLPALQNQLEQFANDAGQQFGSRKLNRFFFRHHIAHNAGFLAKRANSQELSATQRQRYIEFLRGLWKLVPLICKAHVKIPGVLKADLERYERKDDESGSANERNESS